MKAPDVIYANDYGIWYKQEQPVKVTEKYIRKDTLLEWVKANLQDRDNWNEKSAADAFCEVIDKLNSM